MTNSALIFIKPHAVTPRAVEFIETFLTRRGVRLLERGELSSEEIDKRGIIDRHYFAIAKASVELKPDQISVSTDGRQAFHAKFGLSYDQALDAGKLVNSVEAMERLGKIDGAELSRFWSAGEQVKLGPGLYAGSLKQGELLVINGFYPAMKERFTAPGLTIRWYDTEFDPDTCSWRAFRQELIGATKPDQAEAGSLRAELLAKYRELGMQAPPSMTNNGVHASAGPIEGLRERMVWLGVDPASSPFGRELLSRGISSSDLERLLENAPAEFGGSQGPVFDITEDTDARDLLGRVSLT